MFLPSRCPIWWDTAAPRLEWAKIEVDRELPKIGSLAKAVSASRRIERHSAPRDEIPSGTMSTTENIESCQHRVRVIPNISPSHHSASGRRRGRPRLNVASHSRGAIASGSWADTPETRVQGMPGARCTRGLACKIVQKKRTRAYRFSGGNPAFPAQWLYGLCRALPGESGFVVSVASRKLARRPGRAFRTSARLDANR